MRKKLAAASLASLCAIPMLLPSQDASAIPAFARKYGTSCYTCHSGFPARNSFGEAFRNNGYRWPGGEDEEKTKQEQTKLGSEGWKKTFPESPWPGDIPGYVPLSLWFRGQFVNYSEEVKNPAGVVVTKETLNYGTGGLGAASLFFGGTMGDNFSAFGQYNLTNTSTAPSGHIVWSFQPGLNLSFGNAFSDFNFGNAIQSYSSTFPTVGTSTELTYICGQTGGLKLTGGLAQQGTTFSNHLNDIMYIRAKYKFGGLGLLSGAGGTFGNEYVGLDNHIAIGATYMSAQKGVLTGKYLGETELYGADITGSIGNFSLGAAYSKDGDLGHNNYRVDATYFIYPWMKATLVYANLRSGDKADNTPTIAAGLTAHLRANALISATYTYNARERLTRTATNTTASLNTLPDTFALAAQFAF